MPDRAVTAAGGQGTPVTPESVIATGSLLGDLVAPPQVPSRHYRGGFRYALQRVLPDCVPDPHLSACMGTDIFVNARKIMPVVLARAAERGEIEVDAIRPRVSPLPSRSRQHRTVRPTPGFRSRMVPSPKWFPPQNGSLPGIRSSLSKPGSTDPVGVR